MPEEIVQKYLPNMLLIQNGDIDKPNRDEQVTTVQITSYINIPGTGRWVDSGQPVMISVANAVECAQVTVPKPTVEAMTEEELDAVVDYNNSVVSKTDELIASLAFVLEGMPTPLFEAFQEAVEVAAFNRT